MPQRSRGEVPAPRRQPNVLFVFSDQQKNRAWQMNNPLISTPRLMQLAAQGTVVQNAVSQTPICSPFRAMLMSGQYPRTSGVLYNDIRLPANGDRFSEVTARLGYRNGYIGKCTSMAPAAPSPSIAATDSPECGRGMKRCTTTAAVPLGMTRPTAP